MSDQDAVAYDKQRQQGTAIYRLQGNQQEQEERQVYQELEIGTCAYLILKSGSDAVNRYTKMELKDRFALMCTAFEQPMYKVDKDLNVIK